MVTQSISHAYKYGLSQLSKAGITSAKTDVILLLCYILGRDRAFIHAHPDFLMDSELLSKFQNALKQRISHRPIQYITGICEFMSLDFFVNENVLIPRQDTEILLENIFKNFPDKEASLKILDIGTGSGCIAVSLAKHYQNAFITAIDISDGALLVAEKNCKFHNVANQIKLINSNLFENLTPQKFDIIVSNPPYIPTSDISNLEPQVKLHEPHSALDGGSDGLDFYRKIIKDAPLFMCNNGFIAFEVGILQDLDIKNLMLEKFIKIGITKDLSGINRIVYGYYYK